MEHEIKISPPRSHVLLTSTTSCICCVSLVYPHSFASPVRSPFDAFRSVCRRDVEHVEYCLSRCRYIHLKSGDVMGWDVMQQTVLALDHSGPKEKRWRYQIGYPGYTGSIDMDLDMSIRHEVK